MDSGDSQELIDIISFLWRAVCFAFLLFELSLVLRKPVGTGEAKKGMSGEAENGMSGEAGNGEAGKAVSRDSEGEGTDERGGGSPGQLNNDGAEISWRSSPGEELAAQASTLIVMMAALGILIVMDAYREASTEALVDLVIAILVAVVIACPKYYSMSPKEFHVRGSRLEPRKFSGYSFDDMGGIRVVTLQGAVRGILGVRFHERNFVLAFSRDREDADSTGSKNGKQNGKTLHERVEALLRKLYN